MEIRRIFASKIVITYVFIIGFICVLFYKEQLDENRQFLNSKSNDVNYEGCSYDSFDVYREYSKYISVLKGYEPNDWKNVILDMERVSPDNKNEYQLQREARRLAGQQVGYALGYKESIEELIVQSEEYLQLGIYSDSDSYGYHNILKTRYDMKELLDTEVTVSNNKAYEAVYDYKWVVYGEILIIFVIIFAFFEERKKGLWNVVYATPMGRLNVTIKRAGIMLGTIVVSQILIYMLLFAISFSLYGGTDSLLDSIQSVQDYRYCMIHTSKLGYALVLILMQSIGIFAVAMLIWGIIGRIKQINISAVLIGIIGVIEYILYRTVSVNSNVSFLKYINIFTYINPHYILSTYMNMGSGSNIYGRLEVYGISLVIITILITMLVIGINVLLRPIGDVGKIEKLMLKISAFMKYILSNAGLFVNEVYKLLFAQKGIIVMAVVMILAMNAGNVVGYNYDEKTVIVQGFIRTPELERGKEYERLINVVKNIQNQIDEATEYSNVESLGRALENYKAAIKEIDEYRAYEKKMNGQGHDVELIEQYLYEEILGEKRYQFEDEYSLFCILLAMGLAYNLFAYERKSKTVAMIRSTSLGRRKVLWLKYVITFLIIAIMVIIMNIIDFANVTDVYKLKESNTDFMVQSIFSMEEFPLRVSFKEFIVIVLMYRVILIYMMAVIMINLSLQVGEKTCLAIGFVSLAPYMAGVLGMNNLEFLSLPSYVSFIKLWNEQGMNINTFMPEIILCILGMVSFAITYKKWMKGESR